MGNDNKRHIAISNMLTITLCASINKINFLHVEPLFVFGGGGLQKCALLNFFK
jgi:hypothetical protein